MSETNISRRRAIGLAGAALAGCSVGSESAPAPALAPASGREGVVDPARRDPTAIRWAPATELVNTMEFEEQAQRVLAPELFAEIAGGNAEPFNRITFRPRMNVPTLDMDLGVEVFGQTLFTPLVLGPVANLSRYHEGGERALIQGAAEVYTGVIVSSRSTIPFESLVGAAEAPLWYSVYAGDEAAGEQARSAAAAGAGAVFITLRDQTSGPNASIDWRRIDSVRQGLSVPVVVKGITTPAEATAAAERGYDGVVVSNHGLDDLVGAQAAFEVLPSVADTLAGRMPIFVDGGFRRGADILKGLALGATAVLMSRPAAWALAAYGPDGVQSLLHLVHEELARNFGMLGVSTPGQLTPERIRIHRIATA